jgi:DNA-binding protein YbaB
MFGQLGEMKKMYDKYKKLQDALKNIIIRAKEIPMFKTTTGSEEELGILIDISGETKIKEIQIHDPSWVLPADVKKHLEKCMKVAFEKGQAKAQEIAQEKTKEILGFDPSQLAGMMWGSGGGMPNIPGLTG